MDEPASDDVPRDPHRPAQRKMSFDDVIVTDSMTMDSVANY
ncbi:MAG: hypothetical protein ACLVJ6_15080 [Merdibacter sp.]